MAALYLHNAIFIPEPVPASELRNSLGSTASSHYSLQHSRTVSSGTLRTMITTSDPLLSESVAYRDILSRQPSHPSLRQHGEEVLTLSLPFDPESSIERKGFRERRVRKRLRWLHTSKIILEAMLVIWAIYNSVRYFIAYTLYTSVQGQSVSLVLGTLTSLSFAFFSCATILSVLQSRLIIHLIPIRTILIMCTALRIIAQFFLIVPTIVNLALTIAWRSSHDEELSRRCSVDVDMVWSVSTGNEGCNGSNWGVFLAIAIVRTVITTVIIIAHYSLSSSYRSTRHPSLRRCGRRHRHQHHNSSCRLTFKKPNTTTRRNSALAPTTPSPPVTMGMSSYLPVSIPAQGVIRPVSVASSSSSSSSSESEEDSEAESSGDHITTAPVIPPADDTNGDQDLQGFVDRFRSLITQISRQTEDGMRIPMPPRRLGYDEFGSGFPPDESVRVLGTYVRRMPTIESLGSRETSCRTGSIRTEGSGPDRPGSPSSSVETDYGHQIQGTFLPPGLGE